jgi:hypothetical protein
MVAKTATVLAKSIERVVCGICKDDIPKTVHLALHAKTYRARKKNMKKVYKYIYMEREGKIH